MKTKKTPDFPALVFADIHAQKSNLTELTYLFSKEIPEILDECTDINSIVIVGDIFESVSKIDTEVYTKVYSLIRDISKRIDVFIVAGNHDIYIVNGASPLVPFEEIATVYDQYYYEYGVEIIPYSYNMNREYTKDDGITFIHYALKDIVKSANLNYDIDYFDPPSDKRLYVAGHLHFPAMEKNQLSLGTPIPYMFDQSKCPNQMYIIEENKHVGHVKMNISQYNTIEIREKSDLDTSILIGDVSTYVKLKIINDCLTQEDILRYKKEMNIDGVVVARESKIIKQKEKLENSSATNHLGVYRQYIQQDPLAVDKRGLYLKVRESLNEDTISDITS